MHNFTETVDVDFDFTTDTTHYWDGFWEKNDILGGKGKRDPDVESRTLRRYHRILWSRPLPNGDTMDLKESDYDYLTWNGHRFGSDSITASFRYERNRAILEEISKESQNYHDFMEDYIRRAYTIGGCMIFPKRKQSINQCRGTNRMINDRWDLTLECIRRFYLGEESPLYWTLKEDTWFFDLFTDFKGYVDFFFLQDCVTGDYSEVIPWLGDGRFHMNNLPNNTKEYLHWIEKNLEFVEKRNERIRSFTE